MRSKNYSIMRVSTIMSLFVFVLSSFISCDELIEDKLVNYPTKAIANATYYVDSELGDDKNTGTSESTAWKSFSNINKVIFEAGNKILLKRGGVWQGQIAPKGSGTPTNPITLGAYGSGNMPVVDAGGTYKSAVYLTNQSNWIIQDLELKNFASVRGDIYRCGILVENNNGGTISNIKILNNYVHDISGSFRWVGAFDPHEYGGIAVNVIGTTSATDRYDNVLIQGNQVENAGRTGIVVWDNQFSTVDEASSNVIIRENSVKEIDSDGIITYGCYGAIIEYNVANSCGSYREDNQFNGSSAIWVTRGRNCLIQYNEAYNTKALEGNTDGTGFDIDMDAIDCVVQYNYSHDNEGGFMLFVDASNSSGSIVRYNISQNDKMRLIMLSGGVTPGTQIYNNTFYIGTGLDTKIIDHSWDEVGDINASWIFKNNIVYNLGSGNYNIPGTGGIFEGNLYYGIHPVNEPSDASKLTVDPQFENPGSGSLGINSLAGYKLKENSPAMNSGIVIQKNGGFDFWGNIVSSGNKPTRGAHEPNGVSSGGDISITDNLTDWSYSYYRSDNLTLDATNPNFFGGDASRAVRTDLNNGILIYKYNNIKSMIVEVYTSIWYPTMSLQKIKIYGSAIGGDLGNYSEIPVSYLSDTENIVEGWQKTTINVSGTLPSGINYIGLLIAEDQGENWALQVSKVTITYAE